jgi:hypothetical protein
LYILNCAEDSDEADHGCGTELPGHSRGEHCLFICGELAPGAIFERQLGYFPVGARTKEKHGVELQCDFFALWSVYEPFTHI